MIGKKSRSAALAAVLLVGLTAACAKSDAANPNLACSAAAPGGYCAGNATCFSGACVDVASLCSAGNPGGTCAAGSTCFSGGCVVSASLCGSTNTDGVCEDGKTCFGGSCTAAASLCSNSNITGICASGSTCFAGGCVSTSALCSTGVPNGLCAVGSTCSQGACVTTASLCSTSNTAGTCPAGLTCQAGQCAAAAVDPCTVDVNTTQPTIAVAKGSTCVTGAAGTPNVCTPSTPAGILTVGSLKFKDLNKDGKLDLYEDWRKSDLCRARDLAAKMSVAQKIGLMSEVTSIGSGTTDGSFSASTQAFIVTSFGRQSLNRISAGITPAQLATYLNNIQELSESQPLGIPFVVTADPSHGFSMNINATTGVMAMGGASSTGGTGNSSLVANISQWPQPLGIGAINDPAIAYQAGDAIRREFRGMGMRWELGPQADIATEPRWARVNNTFGENPYAVSTTVKNFMQGMQGANDGGLKGGGIASTIKHFPGTGANQGGMDSHSVVGRYNVFPGGNLLSHIYPFRAAIDAGAAAVMPSYSIFKNQWSIDPLQVGSVFSKESVTDLLKTQLGFSGLVTSDWGVMSSKQYGLESTSPAERGALFIKAGAHQIGQDSATNSILLAYQAGLITDAELNNAAAKVLEMSLKLGLFENPYTDYPVAAGTATSWAPYVNSVEARTNGFNAQKMAMVLLRNRDHANSNAYLPIDPTRKLGTTAQYIDDANNDGTIKVYFDGINDSIVGVSPPAPAAKIDSLTDIFGDYDYTAAATATSAAIAATSDITQADVAIIRIVSRKGAYSGLDAGVPLSFDAPFPGTSNDSEAASAKVSRNKVLDALRARDGYTKFDGTVVAATNTNLKIVLVMHMDRPGIVKPFINGLVSLNDTTTNRGTATAPDYYPLVSDETNIFVPAAGNNPVTKGVDAMLVEFGAFDRAVLDFVFNKNKPTYLAPGQTVFHYGTARLPMEIPSTDAAVAAQLEDVPADTVGPTYALGAGSTYSQ